MKSKSNKAGHLERYLRRKSILDYWAKSSKQKSDLEFLSDLYGYCIPYIRSIVGKCSKSTKVARLHYIKISLKKEVRIAFNLGASFKEISSRFNITEKRASSICKKTKEEKRIESDKKKQEDFHIKIFSLWKSGISVTNISKKITRSGRGISKQRVYQILRNSFNIDSARHSNDIENEMLIDFANGYSRKELVDKYSMKQSNVTRILRKSGFIDTTVCYKKEEKKKIFEKSVLDAYEQFKNESDWLLKVTCHLKCYASEVTKTLKKYKLYKSASRENSGKRVSISQSATWASGVRDFWTELCSASWSSALKRVIAMSTKCKTVSRQYAQKNTMLDRLYELHPDAPKEREKKNQRKIGKTKLKVIKNEKVKTLNSNIISSWAKDVLV